MSKIIAAVGIVLICFTPFAFAQESPYWQRAGELIQAQKYSEASSELDRLLIERPDDTLLLRMKAISLIHLRKYSEAASLLNRVIAMDPDTIASRYYLAQTLAYRGNVVEAIELLNEVQKRAPESLYAERAKEILPQLENLKVAHQVLDSEGRFSGSVSLAGEYDDNVLAQAREDNHDTASESFRWIPSTYLEFRPLDQKLDNTPLTFGGGYSFYQSFHERYVLNDFNVTTMSPRLFLRKSGDFNAHQYTIGLESDYTFVRLGSRTLSHESGIKTYIDLQLQDWVVLSPSYSIRFQNFKSDTSSPDAFSRDGIKQSLGTGLFFYTFENRVIFGAAYFYHPAHTDGSNFDVNSHQISSSAQMTLPWKFRLTGGIEYESAQYIHYTPTPERSDHLISLFTGLARPLWRNKLFLETNYTFSRSYSEKTFAEYRRNIFSLSTRYYF